MQTDPGLGDADDQLYEHPSVEWVSGPPHPPSWPRAGKVAQPLPALNTLQTQQEQSSTTPETSPEAERAAKRIRAPLSSLPKLPQLPLLRRLSQCCRSIPEFRGLLLSITVRLLSGPGRTAPHSLSLLPREGLSLCSCQRALGSAFVGAEGISCPGLEKLL